MNQMFVSPWLSVSPSGPVTCAHPHAHDYVHLRQGEMDGACGPYCVVMTLIALGVMSRDQARSLDSFDGRTRLGRFRENLMAFGALATEGTDGFDVSWLVDVFKHVGVVTTVLDVAPRRKTTIRNIADAVDNRKIPIVGVEWYCGQAGHWLLVIGYQGYKANDDDELQITHLLCLDPTSEAPRVSLWNAVIEVFTEEGEAVNDGRYYCRHWGPNDAPTACRIDQSIVVGLDKKAESNYFY
ncbi:hypothetical protein ACF8Q9_13385 [Pseudomonas sp. TYF_15]|uniref:hypothetical protein n=1 Tax=Pseudomonas TaxID=286 RepID=UPI000D47573B|nr:hypothetical protein [Pseudomonas putida]EKT4456798.1 hypothetical protein [Pseudomonas putida]EKT4513744.1 hypothetical protein [Pseudomonas putida]MCG3645201.1 hypothetical protein [Pseudomonas putida]POF91932.1 hypothetical protein BGP83_04230 [Pseudomonas putida]POF98371.1 hypothetical protein BGP81_17250 [Pseudomonas putida]